MAYVSVAMGYLKNPTFMGDGWYIRCSDDEGLMLVIKSKAKTIKSVKARMRKLLLVEEIDADLVGEVGYRSRTAFPPNFAGLHPSWKWEIELNTIMPGKLAVFPKLFVATVPQGSDTYGQGQ